MNNLAYLGVVQHGRFRPLATESEVAGSLRLTTSAIDTSEPPEKGELPLAEYEGSAILVRGVDRSEWVYSATVVENAGLILTAVVQAVFDRDQDLGQHRLRYPLAPG